MKITILAVGSEAQYQPTFDTAYQYLKKETAALSAELSYAICRPDAAELFAALRNAMGQSEAVVLLLSPEPAAVSTALRVVCGGLERTAQTDAALHTPPWQSISTVSSLVYVFGAFIKSTITSSIFSSPSYIKP